MIRQDFVSNSSSTSFMVLVEKSNISKYINALSEKCEDRKSQYHIDNLVNINRSILNYSYYNLRALYVGGLVYYQDDKLYLESAFTKDQYSYYLKLIENKKDNDYCHVKFAKNKKDLILTHFDYVWNMVLPITNNAYNWINMDCKNNKKESFLDYISKIIEDYKIKRWNRIRLTVKDNLYYGTKLPDFSTFVIDRNTINVTKYLLKCGCNLNVNNWNIEELDEIIKDDNVIFNIDMCYEGDGLNEDTIYNENEDIFKIYDTPYGIPIS